MSKEDKNIDKFFKERLYSRQFVFDEAAWDGAKKLLDQNDKKGGGYWRNSLYGLLALLFFSGASYLGYQSIDSEQEMVYSDNGTLLTQGTMDFISVDVNDGHIEQSETSLASTSNSIPTISPIDNTAENNTSLNTTSSTEASPNNLELAVSDPTNVPVEEPVSDVDADDIATEETNPINSSEKLDEPTNEKATPPKTPDVIGGTLAVQSLETEGPVPVDKPEKKTNIDGQSLVESYKEQRISPMMASTDLRMTAITPPLDVEYDRSVLDAPITESEAVDTKEPYNRKPKPYWSAIAGFGPGWANQTPEGSENSPNHVYLGLGYSYPINFRFSLRANLLYQSVFNMQTLLVNDGANYDFGLNEESYSIETRRMSTVTIPVYVNYYFKNKFNAYAGIQMGYMLSTLSDRKAVLTDAFETSVEEERAVRKYTDHVKELQFSGVAGLEYRINQNFDLGLRYQHTLNGLFEPSYFNDLDFKHRFISFNLTYKFQK